MVRSRTFGLRAAVIPTATGSGFGRVTLPHTSHRPLGRLTMLTAASMDGRAIALTECDRAQRGAAGSRSYLVGWTAGSLGGSSGLNLASTSMLLAQRDSGAMAEWDRCACDPGQCVLLCFRGPAFRVTVWCEMRMFLDPAVCVTAIETGSLPNVDSRCLPTEFSEIPTI